MAINIDIAANTRDFQRATKDVERGLSGVADSLDDLVRDTERSADRAGDALGDGFKDAARDVKRSTDDLGDDIARGVKDGTKKAEDSTEKLERSFKELATTAKRETSDLGDGMGKSVKKGTDEAGEGLGEFKDEANSTAREAAASFDGSAASIGDAFQEVAANAFAGFGPAGALAGLAAAAGIGIAFSQMERGKEETEAFNEKVSELGQELIETGGVGETSVGYIVDKLKELATTTEEGVDKLSDLRKEVKTAGGDFEDIAQAYAGSTEELDKLVEAQERHLETYKEEATATDQSVQGALRAATEKVQAQQSIVDKLKDAQTATQQAADQEAAYLASGAAEMEAKGAHIEAIDEAYDDAASGAEDFINKESGIFDVQGFIDSMAQREQALLDYENTLATTNLTPAAKAYIESQGVDSAATFLAGYKTATPTQQAELNRIWTEAGKTSSGSFSAATKAELRQASYEAQVKLNPDASAIRNYLNQTKTQDVLLRVQNRIDLPARSGMGVP